jgi:nitrogen regulatory protein PII
MLKTSSGLAEVKLLCVIINRMKIKKIEKLYRKHRVVPTIACLAEGTADSDILDCLGLGESEKEVVISLIHNSEVPELFQTLKEDLNFKKPGKGIAFTIPAESLMLSWPGCEKESIRKEFAKMNEENDYVLTITVVVRGYAETVMDYAKAAGATGGTIIHSRSLAEPGDSKFFGISLQDEMDILAILVKKDMKEKIINAVKECLDQEQESHGMLLELPVDNVVGLAKRLNL